MLSKSGSDKRQFAYFDGDLSHGKPIFHNLGNHRPVALYGGYEYKTAITNKGEVLFINRHSVKNSLSSPIAVVSLPNDEKASSIACLDYIIVFLSSKGLLFYAQHIEKRSDINLSAVSEFADKVFVYVPGILKHCLAASKNGCVFAQGINGSSTENIICKLYNKKKVFI